MRKGVRAVLFGAAGVALFGSGLVIGLNGATDFQGTFVTADFMKERLKQCKASLTLYRLAMHDAPESPEEKALAFALAGDLGACNALIVNWPDKIERKDKELAESIVAAFDSSRSQQHRR